MTDRATLPTEQSHPASARIDTMSPRQIVELINAEDATVAGAVGTQLDRVAELVEIVADRLGRGGRLFYVGCGTSGRLGVLDASECPPTFGTEPEMIQGIIAGGRDALVRSSEAREDVTDGGARAVDDRAVTADDVVIGIAACGLTPYVLGAIDRARSIGAATGFVTCNPAIVGSIEVDVTIALPTGPELVTGSTRMKAGTATKMVLNMITTGAMILLGKVYGNLMVDLRARSEKLRDRAIRIFRTVTRVEDDDRAWRAITAADGHVKAAILMELRGLSREEAEERLADCSGHLGRALS